MTITTHPCPLIERIQQARRKPCTCNDPRCRSCYRRYGFTSPWGSTRSLYSERSDGACAACHSHAPARAVANIYLGVPTHLCDVGIACNNQPTNNKGNQQQ